MIHGRGPNPNAESRRRQRLEGQHDTDLKRLWLRMPQNPNDFLGGVGTGVPPDPNPLTEPPEDPGP